MKNKLQKFYLFVLLLGIGTLLQNCQEDESNTSGEIQISSEIGSKNDKDKDKDKDKDEVDVCHYNRGTGTWSLKQITANAIQVHLLHGDVVIDEDGDGFAVFNECGIKNGNGIDCNDNDATVNPEVTEICDGIDNNCNGLIDEGVQREFFADADGDGFGNVFVSIVACPTPFGYVSNARDCDDTDPTVNPDATEVCGDSIDNNCDEIAEDCTTTVTSTTGRIWMDRNLGATQVATSSTDEAAYGYRYQWGRDGHQRGGATRILSSTDTPGHDLFIITSTNPPYDWRSPQNANLWQGVNGVNNPCPAGYRLPTAAEWERERLTWTSNDAAGAFASILRLPVRGFRNYIDGLSVGVGSYGYYWSSTVNSTQSRFLRFDSGNAGMFSFPRAGGLCVRCIKD